MSTIAGTQVGSKPSGEIVWAPLLELTVVVGTNGVRLKAIVDSGADDTVIPIEALVGLGVEWDKLPGANKSKGAGGNFERRRVTAQVRVGPVVLCDEVEVAEAGALPVVLLGRSDFFTKFTVTFDWHRSPPVFTVEPISEIASALAPPPNRHARRAAKSRGRR